MIAMRGTLLLLTLALAAPLAAAPRKAAPKPAAPKPTAEEKLIQSCDAHKFETVVDVVVDGQPKQSKVKLCGVEGQSDADWIGTLKDAVRKLEANKDMPAAQREQIVAAIKAEIGRLSIVGAPAPPTREAATQSTTPLSRDYAALPPLPPPVAAPTVAPPPATPVQTTQSQPSISVAAPVRAPVRALPKLSFSCYTPGDIGGEGPCAEFGRETLLTVRAKGNMPVGASLHFIRNGDDRGDLDLAPLSSGRAIRVALPRDVCAGFGAGRLELQVVVSGTPAPAEGPWPLRCS